MTDLLHTPLHALHAASGGRLVDFAGWSMPVQYTSILEEHRATRSRVSLFDVSHMGRLRFDGPQAAETLDRLLTRSVLSLRSGGVRYSLIADGQGRILDDVLVYRFDQGDDPFHLLVVNAGNRDKILRHLGAEQATGFEDLTQQTAMIAVQGPLAVECADALLSVDLPQLKYYRCTAAEMLGHQVLVSRTGYTGEDGCELIVPAAAAESAWRALCERPQRPLPAGLGARDTLRLEAAMPLYGHELSEQISPYQAGLEFAVQLEGREFVGRDPLAALASQPPPSVRVGLQLEGKRIAREQTPVLHDGRAVGTVTSGSFSPTFQRPLAMALVAPGCRQAGLELQVDIRGKTESARVVELPFYRRGKS